MKVRIQKFVSAETSRQKNDGERRRASAGILPICRDSGRMLLNLRSDEVSSHQLEWSVWGGGLEGSESPEQAAIREFREEAGYTGPVRLVRAWTFMAQEKDFQYHHFFSPFEFEFEPNINWESADAKWVSPDRIHRLKNDLHPGLIELFEHTWGLIEMLTGTRPKVSN